MSSYESNALLGFEVTALVEGISGVFDCERMPDWPRFRKISATLLGIVAGTGAGAKTGVLDGKPTAGVGTGEWMLERVGAIGGMTGGAWEPDAGAKGGKPGIGVGIGA